MVYFKANRSFYTKERRLVLFIGIDPTIGNRMDNRPNIDLDFLVDESESSGLIWVGMSLGFSLG